MPGPAKITLEQAKHQGDLMLTFWCHNPNYCYHRGEMRLDDALQRWGNIRLDQVPARCTKCGERKFIDVRARPPHREGGNAVGKVIES